MEMNDYLPALTDAGQRLAAAAERAGMGADVPSCPGWSVRDLLFHQGAVHRWAARVVRESITHPIADAGGADPHRDADRRPPDPDLLGWVRDGRITLIDALTDAPTDLECWSFLLAPSPLVFWARRQTHETTIHGVDAELAAGDSGVDNIDPAVATDGIDELLTGFVARKRGKLRSALQRTLAVHTTDTDAAWHLTISEEPVVVKRTTSGADATVRGPAVDVYLALWNRRSIDAVETSGDADVLGGWADQVRVRWR